MFAQVETDACMTRPVSTSAADPPAATAACSIHSNATAAAASAVAANNVAATEAAAAAAACHPPLPDSLPVHAHIQVETDACMTRILSARVQQAFLPKFENEGQDSSIADAIVQQADAR
jgi:hypothetical protein